MNAFYEHHHNNIRFGYRCFDRILLNGLIETFLATRASGGFLPYVSESVSGKPGCAAGNR